jgi:transglutaminase-like putative cysteine protease
MFISIRHTLRYVYERPVFLEPVTLRLTPRHDATQRVLRHDLRVTPEPQGAAWTIDPDGVDARVLWFAQEHAELTVVSDSLVETLRDNPFDALTTHAGSQTLPASYPAHLAEALAPYTIGSDDEQVRAWAADLAKQAGGDSQRFLVRMAEEIHSAFRITDRPDGDPFTPARTLETREGACRDVTMLFMAACRSQGIAARFVSGYSLNHPPETTRHELHAWAEAYLPGGGWRGYDPSLGLAVADGHIALASGPDHRLAAALTGSYRGTGVHSTLAYEIELGSGQTPEAAESAR